MDFTKIKFASYNPSYDEYFNYYLKDKSITEYVNFFIFFLALIFYDNDFAGFYKNIVRDDDLNDRELYIALIPKYRQKGMASYVVNTLTERIFENDAECEYVHLSIDKDNLASIRLAQNCGFLENVSLEEELRADGDNRTLIFSTRNKNYGERTEVSHTRSR